MGLEALIKEAFVAEGKEEENRIKVIKMLKNGFKPRRIADIFEIDLDIVLKIQKALKAEQKKAKK